MGIFKVNVVEMHSEVFLRYTPDGTPLYKVEMTVSGEGNSGRRVKIMREDELAHVKVQGYYLT